MVQVPFLNLQTEMPLFQTPWIYWSKSEILEYFMLNWSYDSVFPMHSNHIQLDGRKVKYSIIGMRDLREDLYTWKYLSFAGRLHKPVIPLQQYQENFLRDMTKNR